MKIDPEKLFGTDAPPATNVRVRYSYDTAEGTPRLKNTLLSFVQNGRIFFGIARCNLDSGDRFNRKIGRSIACKRALAALRFWEEEAAVRLRRDLNISRNFLFGSCPPEKAKEMVRHFKLVDDTIENCRLQIYAEYERLRAERKEKKKAELKAAEKLLEEEAVA
jgi:hypothetical protein